MSHEYPENSSHGGPPSPGQSGERGGADKAELRVGGPDAPPRDPSNDVVLATLADQPPRRAPSWTARLAILATLVLVLGPVLYTGLPQEIARWYTAAAAERQLEGDLDGALALLDKALAWNPNDAHVFLLRGDWKLAGKDYQGSLADYDQAAERDPKNLIVYIQRSQAFQHLGRHREAIADWQKLSDLSSRAGPENRAVVLNGLAYAMALGNTDLDEAIAHIEQAIRRVGDNAAMLDTRGFIHLLRSNLDPAKRDLDMAVELAEVELKQAQTQRNYVDHREHVKEVDQRKQALAVIRYHRALLHDRLAQPRQAEADRRRVRQLGFEPTPDLF